MAYVEQGTGNPIVFQHGNPTSSYLWRNIMPRLEGLGRLIACDLIGMGDSDKLDPSGPDRYTYEEERDYLFALWEQLGIDHDVVLVIHDWGSVLGFDWANQHRDRVAGIAFMEAIVTPFTWDDMASPEPTRRQAFEDLRSPAGEKMVLENNFFVENRIPNGILRKLSAEEMDTYRRPFANPGEDRRPTLTLPRQMPIDGHPANVVEIVDDYGRWLTRSDVPKLFIKADPGGLLTGRPREFCRTWPNQTEVTVAGKHFVQEDSPDQIGEAVRAFVAGLHRSPSTTATRAAAGQPAETGVGAATGTAAAETDWTFGGLWPFGPRWFETTDGRMHYVDEGPRHGRPVVLVHGNPTWSFLYRNFIGPLTEAGHRAIAPDHLGFGRSDKPSDPELYRIPRHVARLDALLESLDLRDAVLVVQDWGGPIGLSWAVAHPERVSGLFILNTFDGPQPTLPLQLHLFRAPGVGEVLVKGLDMFVRGFLFRGGVVHHERLTTDVRQAYLAPHPTWSSRAGELVFPREIPDPASPTGPVADLLIQLERELEQHFRAKPARIIWPMRDPAFTPAVLQDWCKTLPNAAVTQVKDASHYIQEDAYERIVPQLLSLVVDTN